MNSMALQEYSASMGSDELNEALFATRGMKKSWGVFIVQSSESVGSYHMDMGN